MREIFFLFCSVSFFQHSREIKVLHPVVLLGNWIWFVIHLVQIELESTSLEFWREVIQEIVLLNYHWCCWCFFRFGSLHTVEFWSFLSFFFFFLRFSFPFFLFFGRGWRW